MEDHDDLMPVFAAQSDLLSATYGEFFLADMIELQDNENKVATDLISAPSAIRDPRGGNKNNAKIEWCTWEKTSRAGVAQPIFLRDDTFDVERILTRKVDCTLV